MPNVSEVNRELVRAFNISLCFKNIAQTNLTVQDLHGKDYIVISFDKSMNLRQRTEYLSTLRNKIIKRSYKDEKAAGVSYDLQSFPFKFKKEQFKKDNKGKRFLVEIDKDVVFNLKCYLAQALAGSIQGDIGKEFGVKHTREHIYDISFDRSSYLLCMRFDDKKLQVSFISSFLSKIQSYENAPVNPGDCLEVNGDRVYIKKDIFNDIEFIKDIEAHNASLICRDFEVSIKEDRRLENLKFPVVDFIRKMGIPVDYLFHTSYRGSDENSILVPIKNREGDRFLDSDEVYRINNEFGMEVLSDVSDSISAKLPRSGSFDGVIYGTDFSDLDIACCVMNKIIENSVINKNHALSIDPELRFQSLSPLVSPAHSPSSNNIPGLSTTESTSLVHNENDRAEYTSEKQQSLLNVPESGYGSGSSPEASPPWPPTDDTKAVPQDSKARRKLLFSNDPPRPNLDLTVGGIQPRQSRAIASIEITAGRQKSSNESICEEIKEEFRRASEELRQGCREFKQGLKELSGSVRRSFEDLLDESTSKHSKEVVGKHIAITRSGSNEPFSSHADAVTQKRREANDKRSLVH